MNTYTIGPINQHELDVIANSLAQQPWGAVNDLLSRLQQQVADQDAQRAAHEREQVAAEIRAEIDAATAKVAP